MFTGIKYIGKKDVQDDSVCGTAAVWHQGTVLNFTDALAKRLIEHTDSFELAPINPDEQTFFGTSGGKNHVEADPVSYPAFNDMTTEQLVVSAREEFGVNIVAGTRKKDDVLSEVLHLMRSKSLRAEPEKEGAGKDTTTLKFEATPEQLEAYTKGEVVLALVPKIKLTAKQVEAELEKRKEEQAEKDKVIANQKQKEIDDAAELDEQRNNADDQGGSLGADGNTHSASSMGSQQAESANAGDPEPPTLAALLPTLNKKELIAFAKQEGVKISNTMTEEKLRTKLFAELSGKAKV